jgi:hypothetical protein
VVTDVTLFCVYVLNELLIHIFLKKKKKKKRKKKERKREREIASNL